MFYCVYVYHVCALLCLCIVIFMFVMCIFCYAYVLFVHSFLRDGKLWFLDSRTAMGKGIKNRLYANILDKKEIKNLLYANILEKITCYRYYSGMLLFCYVYVQLCYVYVLLCLCFFMFMIWCVYVLWYMYVLLCVCFAMLCFVMCMLYVFFSFLFSCMVLLCLCSVCFILRGCKLWFLGWQEWTRERNKE